MPRSRTGVKRAPVNEADINTAVNRVLKNELSIREASRTYSVSKTTLIRHLKQHKASGQNTEYKYVANNNTKQVFSVDEETELKNYLITAARLHYGLTKLEVRILAYDFAVARNKKFPSTWSENKKAGKEWLRHFLKRYSRYLSLRKPEATSLARSTAFNKATVSSFFEKYKNVLSRTEFPPHRIWNCDESGFTTVHVPPKIIGPKGIKQVGQMTSGERGQNVTLIAAINASGNHIPPMMVFPRVNFKDHMLKGAPVGTIGGANASGWSNESLFLRFLQHFKEHVKPSVEEPVILLLDNHDSHVNIPVIDFSKSNGIILVTFYPHTSHKMQPLDRTVFGPMKTYFNTACSEWMLMHPGQPISIYDIAELIGIAFPKAFSSSNISKGFEVSGLYPVNENIFQEDEFLSSYVSDRPLNASDEDHLRDDITNSIENPKPGTSKEGTSSLESAKPRTSKAENYNAEESFLLVTPEMLRPHPKAPQRKMPTGGRRRGKSRILTDTPEKLEVLASKQPAKSTKRQVFGGSKKYSETKREMTRPVKKAKTFSSSSESENDIISANSESSEEEFDTWRERLKRREEENILERKLEDGELENGDYVLVKVPGKKKHHYYLGEIVRCGDNSENEVRYLRRYKETNKFINDAPTTYSFLLEDIITKLPPPSKVGGTARKASMLCFGVNFGPYKVE